jgi:hypothetical protein
MNKISQYHCSIGEENQDGIKIYISFGVRMKKPNTLWIIMAGLEERKLDE